MKADERIVKKKVLYNKALQGRDIMFMLWGITKPVLQRVDMYKKPLGSYNWDQMCIYASSQNSLACALLYVVKTE